MSGRLKAFCGGVDLVSVLCESQLEEFEGRILMTVNVFMMKVIKENPVKCVW